MKSTGCPLSSFRIALAAFFLLAVPSTLRAQSYTQDDWTPYDGSTDWGTAMNWTPAGVPGASAIVGFTGSSTLNVSLSGGETVGTIELTAPNLNLSTNGNTLTVNSAFGGSSGSTFTLVGPSGTLNLGGNGITGGVELIDEVSQTINSNGASNGMGTVVIDDGGDFNLSNGSNAGSIAFTNGDDNTTNTGSGSIAFNDTSNAGTAQFTNNYGGEIFFNDESNAASSTINNNGNATNAALLSNSSGLLEGLVQFGDESKAGDAQLTNNGGKIIFQGSAVADSATISNVTGKLSFAGSADAAIAVITNSGLATFADTTTADEATIINEATGIIGFSGSATAAAASITNDGELGFSDSATGGRAVLVMGPGSLTDISEVTAGSVSLGSLAGAGTFALGDNNLRVGSLGTSTTFSGTLQDGGLGGGTGGSLTKDGKGTFTLSGANTYTGGTTVDGGTLDLVGATGSLSSTSTLTFNGGNFIYDNSASTGAESQSLGTLTFAAGGAKVESELGSSGSASLSFSSLASRATGATGNFSIVGGVNGSTNKIVLSGQATGFIDPGIFFGGGNYATYAAGGYVRGINYGVDSNSVLSAGGNAISGTLTSATNVEISGAITAQTSAAFNTLNLGGNSLTLAAGQTLTLNGLLESGGSAVISGGNALAYGGYGSESDLVIRANQASDSLTIDTPISAGTITKAGDGTLNLGSSYTGSAYVDGGSLGVGAGTTLTGNLSVTGSSTLNLNGTVAGNVSVGSAGTVTGGGTITGKLTVSSGGSTNPGDPQILTAATAEYQSGSTAQFLIATSSSSAHPPVAGIDYDQLKLTANSGTVLQIDSGTTTLQLNFSAASLAAVQANAAANLADNYFLFTLGSGTSSGMFTDLTVTEGSTTYTDPITNGTADVSQLGLQFTFSSTADSLTNTLTGGNDLAFTVQSVPEPSTIILLLAGFAGMFAFSRRAKARPDSNCT
jgi:autotransporter-associated beta strand protein